MKRYIRYPKILCLDDLSFNLVLSGINPTSSVQIMNQTNKNSFGLTAMGGGGNVETYKSLGDVFGIQAAVDSMKTAAYANQEMVAASSSSNVNGNHSIHDMSQGRHATNMTDGEKRSNGGKFYKQSVISACKIVQIIILSLI